MSSQLITLPGGRRLAYAESGDAQGTAVIFFHGGPGSTLPMQPDEGAIAASLGIRLITVERPGYGGSDPHPGRRLLDWPSDVRALVDHLGIARFSLIGFSAGSPYALACAARLAERLNRVVIVGGSGPMYRPDVRRLTGCVWRILFFLSAFAPGVIRFGELDERAEAMVKATPAGRHGTAAEIAEAVLYFLKCSNFTTGQNMAIDGGLALR